MNRFRRLAWWWRSAWGATRAGLGAGGGSSVVAFRWAGPGPAPDLSRLRRPVWQLPEDELGVSAPTRAVLVSDGDRALVLQDCVGYSTGFELTLSLRSRAEMSPTLFQPQPAPSQSEDLVVRVIYPDGATGASPSAAGDPMRRHYEAFFEGKEAPIPATPVVMPTRGGGGGRRYDRSFTCWPLPPDGEMTVTVAWKHAQIPETSVVIDATAIRRAGLSSKKLWS